MDASFLYRTLPIINKRVHRLGLSFNYGIDERGVEAALDLGVNYLFWTQFRTSKNRDVVKSALKKDRDRFVLATGATLGYFAGSVRRGAEKMLRAFGVDYIDVYHVFWVGTTSAWTASVEQELLRLKEEGLIRAIGISIHDRKRAARLVETAPIDLFMLRYNAAHPGAETDVFPTYERRRPITIAYTATSWRKLLNKPRGWDGPPMTPSDCYRFCLTSEHVDAVLCGAADREEIVSNLEGLERGPLSDAESKWMRDFGRRVHG